MVRLHKAILLGCIVAILLPSCRRAAESNRINTPGLVIRLASGMNPNTRLWEPANLFKKELEKAAPELNIEAGEIEVLFYDQGSIGSERQLLEAAYFGVIEVVQINTSVVTTVEPSYSVLNLPYLFENDAHLNNVLYGDIGTQLLNRLRNHNFQGLSFFSAGFRNMFYRSPSCAETPEDLTGLKIRVMESPIMISGINAIGPSATPIPFSELYQSIRTGVVDGAENSINVFVASRFYEAGINCFTFTEHTTDQHVLIANAEWLDNLAPKYRTRILDVADTIIPQFNAIWEEATLQAANQIKSQGVTVNRVDNKDEFIGRVQHIADQFLATEPPFSRELYQKIKEAGNNSQ